MTSRKTQGYFRLCTLLLANASHFWCFLKHFPHFSPFSPASSWGAPPGVGGPLPPLHPSPSPRGGGRGKQGNEGTVSKKNSESAVRSPQKSVKSRWKTSVFRLCTFFKRMDRTFGVFKNTVHTFRCAPPLPPPGVPPSGVGGPQIPIQPQGGGGGKPGKEGNVWKQTTSKVRYIRRKL